jgi:hypothetical protein
MLKKAHGTESMRVEGERTQFFLLCVSLVGGSCYAKIHVCAVLSCKHSIVHVERYELLSDYAGVGVYE